MILSLQISFGPEEYEEFMRPISGDGGGQQFVRHCQSLMMQKPWGGVIHISGDLIEKWFRYRDDYGPGGFQSRLGRKDG